MTRVIAAGVFASVVAALSLLACVAVSHGFVERASFKAFYCAGVAVNERRDPYLVEPLRTCEKQVAQNNRIFVESAPLPGYALGFFSLLSRFPAREAAYLLVLLLVAASALCAWCVARISGAQPVFVLLALAPLTMLNVLYGETPPLALLPICAAAYLLYRGKPVAAGVAVVFAMFQPNVGLPAVIAVFLFVPRARAAVALCAAALAAVSLGAIGVRENIEYFSAVLPVQAYSELVASDQYSASRLFYEAGVPARLSLLLADAFFIIVAASSIAIARSAYVRTRRVELLALVPSAISLIGVVYLHDLQMIFAVPAAFVVTRISSARTFKIVAATSLAMLIAVWTEAARRALLSFDVIAVAGGLYGALPAPKIRRITRAVAGAAAIAACVAALQYADRPRAIDTTTISDAAFQPTALAATAWGAFLRGTPSRTRVEILIKIPTWIALIGLALCTLELGRGRSRIVVRRRAHSPKLVQE